MNDRLILAGALIAACCLPLQASADGKAIAEQQCAGCHALVEPDYATIDKTQRPQRKAPPLYYAGNKFRQDWLLEWLQAPQRIRPAGVYPPAHTVTKAAGDEIDQGSLPEHLALDATQAAAVTDYLMSLHPYDQRIAAQNYEPGSIALRMGQLNFGKFKGCDACHRDEPDYGGVSGPELHTAWRRLQPGFIASFIADPVSWDPHTLMPKIDLNESSVQKLADYLKVIAGDQP